MTRKFLIAVGVCVALIALTTLAVRTAGKPQPAPPADLVLTNGKIVTVDDAAPEAQALAVRGDRIVALGASADIKSYIGPATEIVDLQGQLAIPGFIEGHGHFTGVGTAELQLKLMKTTSWDEIVSMVAAAVKTAKRGQWIYGRGWHQEKWTSTPTPNVEGFPTRASLDAVSPDNPVLLTHASGHASFANSRALQLSGISRTTPNPAGGELLRDATGAPTGLMRERASGLIRRGIGEPTPTAEESLARGRRILELASREALSKGITTFHDAGSSFADVDLMKAMVDEGKMGVRLWIMIRENNVALAQNLAKYRMVDYGGGHLTVRAIKHSIDGALGSRGAWLLEPYSDKPDSTGLNTTTPDVIAATAVLAVRHDYQMCVHAIGDRANRETLNIFEQAFKANPARRDLRWRVEHAQHLSLSDIPRFGQLGVIASMQGIHCTSDAPYVPERLGLKRAEEGAYVWQKLMKSGASVINGTDAPVEDVDPIASYYATVSRRTAGGAVFFPDQRMSRMEALKSYTLTAAFAGFDEGTRGSLTVGKYADVTVLSKDILTVAEDQIPTAQVSYTIVGGKIMYKK
jgi:predicted amidohydrolase YtcJ